MSRPFELDDDTEDTFAALLKMHGDLTYEKLLLMSDMDPKKPVLLSMLSNWLWRRFKRLGAVADIDKAILVQDNVVRLVSDSHPEKPGHLTNLGIFFTTRFRRLGDLADMGKAISTQEEAVRLTPDGHPYKPGHLSSLGNTFQDRFKHLGDIADIEKAISAQENAVRLTPDSHHEKPGCLTNLGNALRARFRHLGDLADIGKAILAQEKAVRLTPIGHSDKPGRLNNLGISFLARFKRLGSIADIDEAISVQDTATQLTPDDHPDKPSRLNNLGALLISRFQRLRDFSDIKKAISAQENAVRLTPDKHPDKPGRLTNLGNSLRARFTRLGDIADIDRAILAHNDAVQLTPDVHPAKPGNLNNLGHSYQARFERLGNVADIDRAILAQDNAVHLTPDGHPGKPGHMSSLGNSLQARFKRVGDIADIDRAIVAQDNAVKLTPDDHPHKPGRLHTLGISLQARFKCLGDGADIDKAISYFSSAACSSIGPALYRFHAALKWATCTPQTGDTACLDAYRCALNLLPRVAWLGLPLAEQHRELTGIGTVVRDAAAAAIAAQKYETALEWLEQGRSIVWGQILHLRSPVDDLRVVESALANRLSQVSAQLERATIRDIDAQSTHQPSLEHVGRHHRELAAEWEKLVESARAVPGFEDFLQPKKLSRLISAAQFGPVVVINVHKERCDALIITAGLDEVIHVPLDLLSYHHAEKLQRSLEKLLSNNGVRVRYTRHLTPVTAAGTPSNDNTFKMILSELWLCVVKPVLEVLHLPKSRTSEHPRIWWCATGPLAFLPLHAAGLYHTEELGTKASDFVVSSYTPTLTTLLDSTHTIRPGNFRLLVVTQSSTPGQSLLPNTERELKHIQQRAGIHPVMGLEGERATVASVIQGMKESTWIHLACHGTQDNANSTKSALVLQDGRLELSEIIKMTLPNADFAYLSACQTATGDQPLTEEAVHLAAGMLLTGYRGVIATTWSIKDNDAPFVADEVYTHLFNGGQPDRSRAAHALHHAVQRLRAQGAPFISWVPFIHLGL